MNVLITGASRGIGLALVNQCIERNWRVFACCRHPFQAEKLLALAEMSKQIVSVHILDLDEISTIQSLAYELRNEPIDILINNAGVYGSSRNSFGNVDADDWLHTFKVNTVAPMKVVEAFHENLKMGKGRVVACMSSKMGSMDDNTSGGSYIYRSSKAALNAVVKSLSVDLRDDGIRCVALHPGWVKTEMGGPDAEISTRQSASQLFDIITGVEDADSGRFIDIDGSTIAW